MTIAYFDCFNGAAGDMLLGSLLDAGLELAALERVLAVLPLSGYRIEHSRTTSYGISGSRVRVLVDAPQPQRDWRAIRAMLTESALPEHTRRWALGVFERLARAEGAVHGVAVDDVHFHEVGAVDSIVDTVGVCAGLELLHVEQVYASPLPSGSGWAMTQHGRIPVPAPATLALLAEAGAPLVPSPARGELVTPTAAALLGELATFTQPSIHITRVGYGLGQKDFGWVNGLRVWLGEAVSSQQSAVSRSEPERRTQSAEHSTTYTPMSEGVIDKQGEEMASDRLHSSNTTPADCRLPTADWHNEDVVELRCNLDDASGELIAYAIERALAAGALDAWAAPLTMKKGRPGVQLACLARPADVEHLTALLLRETPTLGVRWNTMHRLAAGRQIVQAATPWGNVRIKIKLLNGAPAGAAPEYEDCAAIARAHAVPLASVYAAALSDVNMKI